LYQIVTDDEKWIYYDNPKRKKSWVNNRCRLQNATFTKVKFLLCIWWDMRKNVVYYELLNQTAAKYLTTINQFESEISNNASKKKAVILSHCSIMHTLQK